VELRHYARGTGPIHSLAQLATANLWPVTRPGRRGTPAGKPREDTHEASKQHPGAASRIGSPLRAYLTAVTPAGLAILVPPGRDVGRGAHTRWEPTHGRLRRTAAIVTPGKPVQGSVNCAARCGQHYGQAHIPGQCWASPRPADGSPSASPGPLRQAADTELYYARNTHNLIDLCACRRRQNTPPGNAESAVCAFSNGRMGRGSGSETAASTPRRHISQMPSRRPSSAPHLGNLRAATGMATNLPRPREGAVSNHSNPLPGTAHLAKEPLLANLLPSCRLAEAALPCRLGKRPPGPPSMARVLYR
jgi:hypothetical protein